MKTKYIFGWLLICLMITQSILLYIEQNKYETKRLELEDLEFIATGIYFPSNDKIILYPNQSYSKYIEDANHEYLHYHQDEHFKEQ